MAHCPVVNFGGNKKNEIDDGEGREKATPQHRSSTNNKHTGPRAARRDNAFVTKIEETVNLSAYAWKPLAVRSNSHDNIIRKPNEKLSDEPTVGDTEPAIDCRENSTADANSKEASVSE